MALAFAATVTNRWFVARRGLVTGVLTAAGASGQLVFLPLLSWIVDDARLAAGRGDGRAAPRSPSSPSSGCCCATTRPTSAWPPTARTEFVPKPAPVRGAARRALRVLRHGRRAPALLAARRHLRDLRRLHQRPGETHFVPAAHDHGMPVTAAASLLAVIGVFDIVGTVASGWFTDRFDAAPAAGRLLRAARTSRCCSCPCCSAPASTRRWCFFIVFYGLDWVATVPPTLALCREHYGEDSAIVFGWVLASHQVGAALVAFLGGVARDAFGSYDVVWYALRGAVRGGRADGAGDPAPARGRGRLPGPGPGPGRGLKAAARATAAGRRRRCDGGGARNPPVITPRTGRLPYVM